MSQTPSAKAGAEKSFDTAYDRLFNKVHTEASFVVAVNDFIQEADDVNNGVSMVRKLEVAKLIRDNGYKSASDVGFKIPKVLDGKTDIDMRFEIETGEISFSSSDVAKDMMSLIL